MIWIETETKNQEPDKTTQIFKLQRGARQEDFITTYLFHLCLEVFYLIKKISS